MSPVTKPPRPGPRVRPDRLLAHARRVADLLLGRFADEARKPEVPLDRLVAYAKGLRCFLRAAMPVAPEVGRKRPRGAGDVFARIKQLADAKEVEGEADEAEKEIAGSEVLDAREKDSVEPSGFARNGRDEPLTPEEEDFVTDFRGPNARAKREDYRATAARELEWLERRGAGAGFEAARLRRRLRLLELAAAGG